jgi:hypothetical protein
MLYLTKLIQSSYVRTLAACGAILATCLTSFFYQCVL